MADLKDLQKRLNEDEKLRNKFLRDPVKTLEAEGVEMTAPMKTALKSAVTEMKKKPAGAAGSSAAKAKGVKITITITVKF